jgi:hypothetical protein
MGRMTFLIFLAGIPFLAGAGRFPQGIGLEARVQYGFIIRHHLDMDPYANKRFPAFELSLTKQTDGDKAWQHAYAFPEFGLSFFYSDLGDSPILGSVHALYPWLRFPLLRDGGFGLAMRIGFGAGFFNSPFEQLSNYKNLSIGSAVNACIQFDLESRIAISDRFFLKGGFSFTHFSNGVMKSPNYGINIPMLNAGIVYFPRPVVRPERMKNLPTKDKRTEMRISLNMGMKEIEPILGPQYATFCLSGDFVKPVSMKSRLGAGLDLFLDTSDQESLAQEGDTVNTLISVVKPGLKGIYELDVDRLRMDFEMGLYLYCLDNSNGSIYHKLGLKYFIDESLFLGFTLKTHYARADYIALGIGYVIKFGHDAAK